MGRGRFPKNPSGLRVPSQTGVKHMKIAVAQINPIIADFAYNSKKIIAFANRAKAQSCDLVIFSELVLSGYPPRDFLEKQGFIREEANCLEMLVNTIRGIGVVCGCLSPNLESEGNPLYNSAVLFEDGRIIDRVHKQLLPTYDIFDETRFFEPGRDCRTIAYKGHRMGLTVCEDIWSDLHLADHKLYTISPVDLLARGDADFIINISASPFHLGKSEQRSSILKNLSLQYQMPILYANQVGGNDHVLFDGHSLVYGSGGTLLAQALDFEEDLITVRLEGTAKDTGDIRPISTHENESMLKALVMGTRDYVHKCGFSTVVVGLSGGIDSALTACIAVMALGAANVSAVFMPSRYTAQHNVEDTRDLAANLGIRLETVPIDGMFNAFVEHLSPNFNPADPGIVEQNIQARIRGTILMGFSNRDGSMLLTTGNKSELAVGYCTLYGDMNGGLAVISDVPKTTVYEISRFINSRYGFIPQRIIDKAPSAELKPDQADQDDLPPYDILDQILKSYIEDFKSEAEIVALGHDPHLVADTIQRVDRNEYKRHQAAPGLKVTSKAFGWGRRYPLAQRFRPIHLHKTPPSGET